MISYTVFFIYFGIVVALKKKESEAEKIDDGKHDFRACNVNIWKRFFYLYIFILMPTFAMIFLGSFLSIRKYDKRTKRDLVPESNYN